MTGAQVLAPLPEPALAAPVAALQAVFAEIADTRMRGLPILHPGLHVEAVAFRAWEGRCVGVLVTPWAISLVLLGSVDAGVRRLPLGDSQDWSFPSGTYGFMGFLDARLEGCQLCPLISPVEGIANQDEARAVALAAMEALFTAAPAVAPATASPAAAPPAAVQPAASAAAQPAAGTRRAFLRAVLPGA